MADRRRVSTYRDALARTAPGRVVCELGVGHVPLGLMALQLGAERVYAVDSDPEALALSLRSVQEHGFTAEQYITVCGHPGSIQLPERVDVIASEPLSSLGFCEDTGRRMTVAYERLLAPGGLIMPQRIRCYAALAGPTQFDRQLGLWSGALAEVTGVPPADLMATFRSTTQTMVISPSALLGDWAVWREFDFADPGRHRQSGPLVLSADRLGVAHGVACCFEADLCDEVVVRSFPDAAPTPWQQAFAPFADSLRVDPGDAVYVSLTAPEQDILSALFESRVLGTLADGERTSAA